METLEVIAGAAPSPSPSPSRRRWKAEASASRLGSAQTLIPSGLPSHGPSADSNFGTRENPFRVGDFVWGKVKSSPWCPGKVLDTLENATGSQRKTRRLLLVSFFGDVASAWCEQSQLKQFREEFEQMVKQSSSLSFVGAVTDALDEIRICLDSQNTCYCVLEKNPAKVGESYAFGRLPVTNYSVTEFLDHLCNVARDVMIADALEVTMLLSWAISLRRSDGCSVDLVGDNQIDDQPVDVAKDKMEEEFPVSDRRAVKRPEISKELKPRKERSIAELIAGPNIGKSEHCVDNGEKVVDLIKLDTSTSSSSHLKRKKKGESSKNSNVDNGEYKAVENTVLGGSPHDSVETDSHRRVRKMSKYLSPPYLYLSGYSKHSFLTDDAILGISEKEFKASESMPTESPQNLEGSHQVSRKEGDKIGLLLDDGASTDKILNELLATATNHLHLKWNRSANKVRNFFGKFRSYTYIEGSYFGTYQKFLDSLSSVDSSSINHDSGDGSGKGKSSWRRIERKNDANQKTPLEKSKEMTNKSPKTRKYDEEGKIIGETHLTVNLGSVNDGKEVCAKKRQKTKVNALGQNLPEPSLVLIDPLKECITRNTTSRGKMVDSGSTPVFISQKLANHSEASNLDRRKSRKALNSGSVGVDQKPGNGSEESSFKEKRKTEESNLKQKRKTKHGANSENVGALNLTFAPGSTLPSKDELVSAFIKFGKLIESETELLKDSHSACVLFARAIDARKAFKGLGEGGVLGTSVANYKLYFPQGSTNSPSPKSPALKTPLPYIKKNLEKMMARLAGSTGPDKDMRSSNQLRPELASKLLGDMEGMLKKVNKLLTEPSAGTLS